jgi:hypothetical protein
MDRNSVRVDFVSVLQIARALALMDRAALRKGGQTGPRQYAIDDSALLVNNLDGMILLANDEFEAALERIQGVRGRSAMLAEKIRAVFQELPDIIEAGAEEAADGAIDLDDENIANIGDIGQEIEEVPEFPTMGEVLMNLPTKTRTTFLHRRMGSVLLETMAYTPTARLGLGRTPRQPMNVDVYEPESRQQVNLTAVTRNMDPVTSLFSLVMSVGRKALHGKFLRNPTENFSSGSEAQCEAAVRSMLSRNPDAHMDRDNNVIRTMVDRMRGVVVHHPKHSEALRLYIQKMIDPTVARLLWDEEGRIFWKGVYIAARFISGLPVGALGYIEGAKAHRIQQQWHDAAQDRRGRAARTPHNPQKRFKYETMAEILHTMAVAGPDTAPASDILAAWCAAAARTAREHIRVITGAPIQGFPILMVNEFNWQQMRTWRDRVKVIMNRSLAFTKSWEIAITATWDWMGQSVYLIPTQVLQHRSTALLRTTPIVARAPTQPVAVAEIAGPLPGVQAIRVTAANDDEWNLRAWAVALLRTGNAPTGSMHERDIAIREISAGRRAPDETIHHMPPTVGAPLDILEAYQEAVEEFAELEMEFMPDVTGRHD